MFSPNIPALAKRCDSYNIFLFIRCNTFALIFQIFRLRLSYTWAHKSGAFALSFGVIFARIFSQLLLSHLLLFYIK